jgi:hypothetical protein
MKRAKDQMSSMDFEIGSSAIQKSSTKYARNQWSGHSNDGRLVQMDQQPNRRGNDGSCGHAGYADRGRKPDTMDLMSRTANPDQQRYGSQHRGSTMTMPTRGRTDFNAGRGPTRGNDQ